MMGAAYSTRLLVWNRTRAEAEILAAAGAEVAPRFTGLVTSIDLDAAGGAAARPSGYRDGRR